MNNEVFIVKTNGTSVNYPYTAATLATDGGLDTLCSKYVPGSKGATKKQLKDALDAGAQWCSYGWVSDDKTQAYFPYQVDDVVPGAKGAPALFSGGGSGNLTCYGPKPAQPNDPKSQVQVLPFYNPCGQGGDVVWAEFTKAATLTKPWYHTFMLVVAVLLLLSFLGFVVEVAMKSSKN